ncbi:cyclic-phosphate processing receiver domain-containing protein [Pseudomonas syringae]|uniref:cyclic-phosphate processing receiver domain-containing protein n=5 Tax=Pseudomonas syringae TaxID=317 RepID=UPI000A7330B1|nr:cyclic-phosphate processing receiver domain-containing protein [Pseudomonas syringae]
MKKIKVFLDDIRTPPAGWILVHWPNEAIKLLQEFDVEEISLDHDLGDDQRGTGYDVILWIEEKVALDGFVPPKIVVHSANVSARLKMEQGIKNIIKLSKHYE